MRFGHVSAVGSDHSFEIGDADRIWHFLVIANASRGSIPAVRDMCIAASVGEMRGVQDY